MFESPWPANKLKRLGRSIRDETPVPDDCPSYADVMLWFNDVATEVQRRISDLRWEPLLNTRRPEITSRPKTVDTLREKLRRDPATPLPSVQDIAGVRFEAEMTLDEQDAVVHAITQHFALDSSAVRDLRANPHSGYRAVHVWLRLPARVEVQIRTHLQGDWANAYEAAADVFGRDIRYGVLPSDARQAGIVQTLQDLSVQKLSEIEAAKADTQRSLLDLPVSLEQMASRLPRAERRAVRDLIVSQERAAAQETELRTQIRAVSDQFRSLRR